ncbi:DUF3035 domain-containing protein [Sphingomonas nostoxanthinifaciens]|uniref:DUF3035 domain-containing protein n=1 Tax=Sphingomonas nostoxanthinifaciens TaxID=2872652 RepID=UPI001CC1CA98|nr:DUF3035 domain-containing protein [Sphingomonas nostoxanthinifaciens]UAK24889.1 DUF3035 domain-containing protein [Sphingomonas nostoxanthinifaciens]
MNKRNLAAAAPLAAILLLGGCHSTPKGVFQATHHGAPDEFAVGRQAPLTVPPDFALAPPRPGQPRPQEADSSTQALSALFGGSQPVSQGEAALINDAGGAAPVGIRTEASSPGTNIVNKGQGTRDILNAPASNNPQANARTDGTAAAAPAAPATPPAAPTDKPKN